MTSLFDPVAFADSLNYPTIGLAWAQAQACSIAAQLNWGIRYLDFRLIWNHQSQYVALNHSFQTIALTDALQEVRDFITSNPTEVVVIFMTSGDSNLFFTDEHLTEMPTPTVENANSW